MKNKTIFGSICGIVAAICYGTNPLGALKLYAEGMTTNSVLFYRFALAWLILVVVMLFRRESLKVNRREILTLLSLGVLFTLSALTLYVSFTMMAAGVASTILFTYPIMTAVIMALFFRERPTLATIFSILLSLAGVMLLYWGDGTSTLSGLGVLMVLLSALTYALYIIVVNRCPLDMSSFKINFYVILFCALGMLVYSLLGSHPLQLPATAVSWFYVGWLAVVPAILALVLMVYASKYVGATPTAIMGALEPLTAVLIGIFVFGELFSLRLALGIVLILAAVMMIVLSKASKSKAQ